MRRPRFDSPRARFLLAGATGGAIALVVFAWFALEGRPDLFATEPLAQFYEVQARTLLHGHWDASKDAYLFERFNVDGRYYTYFGPWPALLRMPVVAFTDSLDGQLSRAFMILAFAITLAFATRLAWQTRVIVRGNGPVGRWTLVGAGAFVIVAGCGSTALFLASETWVYHEAILWGIAWSLASFSFLIDYLTAPSRRSLALASTTAAFAYLSRGSIGLGPVAALALILLARVLERVIATRQRRRSGTTVADDPERSWFLRLLGLGRRPSGRIWPLATATGVPIALYAYVNFVKFGTLFGTPPYHLQDLLAARVSRQAALDANGGSLFGLGYAPTILLQYLRPDAIGFDRLFPWVTFASPPRIVGDVVFEAANFSTSVPTTSSLLVVLSLVGVVAVVRSPWRPGAAPTAAILRVPMLGAAVCGVGTFVLAFLEQRYQGDFVPFLVLAGAVGLWSVARWLEDRGVRLRRVVAGVLVVLGVSSVWAVFSLTLLQQREYGPLVSTSTRARFLDFQVDVHEQIPGGLPSSIERGPLPLPEPAAAGTLFVAGECEGLYWSNGRFWHPVEQTPATGRFHLRLEVTPLPPGTLEPVLAATDVHGESLLWLRHVDDRHVRFEYEWTGQNQSIIEGVTLDADEIGERIGRPVRVPADGELRITARMDPAGYVAVRHGGRIVLSTIAPVATTTAAIGSQDITGSGATTFAGRITSLPVATPLCDRLSRSDA